MTLSKPHCIYDILDRVFESSRSRIVGIAPHHSPHQQGRISKQLFVHSPTIESVTKQITFRTDIPDIESIPNEMFHQVL